MANYLLDTDAIIDYLRGIPTSVSLIQDLHDHGDVLCVCDIVIAEVYAGLHPPHRNSAAQLLSACTFLPTAPAIARQAGTWRYDFARKGITLATSDTLIAATALAHHATVVTGNAKDYPMPEVTFLSLERTRRKGGGGT